MVGMNIREPGTNAPRSATSSASGTRTASSTSPRPARACSTARTSSPCTRRGGPARDQVPRRRPGALRRRTPTTAPSPATATASWRCTATGPGAPSTCRQAGLRPEHDRPPGDRYRPALAPGHRRARPAAGRHVGLPHDRIGELPSWSDPTDPTPSRTARSADARRSRRRSPSSRGTRTTARPSAKPWRR